MLESLLKNLASWDGSVREKAIQQALTLPPDGLLRLLELEAKRSQREKGVFRLLKLGLLAGFIGFLWLSYLCMGTWADSLFGKMSVFCLQGAISTFVGSYAYPFYARRSVAAILENVQDTRVVPLLLRMEQELSVTQMESRNMVRAALTRLLPQMRRNEVNTWTKSQKWDMFSILESPERNVTLTVNLLNALEQAGDASVIPIVEDLQYYSSVLQVRKAARECLPYLQQRARETRQSNVLLRASRKEAPTGELLKPAIAQGETSGEQLLRAGIKEK